MRMGSTRVGAADAEYDIAAPRAGALIEALRGFGYTPRTAIADLIDNSISARARTIWLEAIWEGRDSYLSVRDDGDGMSEQELIEAMRPGSRNPLEDRDPRDLGRFGLGLKTASFSQCRRLTVCSRRIGARITTRRWDLDYVGATGEWRLLKEGTPESRARLAGLEEADSGTVVLWEGLDRIVGDADPTDNVAHDRFRQVIADIKRHLGMVFHRFLGSPHRLHILVNGRPVAAWDPFLTQSPATQQLGEETLRFQGQEVIVRPYVLPHHSKLNQTEHATGAGSQGWNAQQGFYVYRNERLLVAGDWLGLPFTKEEHYKLARIQVDLPNTLDREWQIDVRKSRARPPGALREDFRRIAGVTRERAVGIYRHRGKIIAHTASAGFVQPWARRVLHGKVSYRINREHPLVRDLLALPEPRRSALGALLRLIEETVPVPLVAIDHAERPGEQAGPFEGAPSTEVREVLTLVYQALRRDGLEDTAARERLLVMEPFQHYPELVATLETPAGEGGEQ